MGRSDYQYQTYSRSYRKRHSAKVKRARFKFIVSSIVIVAVIAGSTVWMLKHKDNDNSVDGQVQTASSENAQQTNVVSKATQGTADFTEWNKTCDWKLLVVNYGTKVPGSYTVETQDVGGTPIGKRIYTALEQMRTAAGKDGITLWISSGYRSNEVQTSLFQNEVKANINKGMSQNDAEKTASTAVAIPGTSEHQTGLAVDLNDVSTAFENTQAYRWLSQHAAEYGFVQRYAEDKKEITHIIYEPWHYRYVGVENAKEMNSKNMCLEEYVQYLVNNK